MDPKKKYVVDTILGCVAGTGERSDLVDKLASDPAIEKFLVDVETRSLQAYRSKDSEEIKVTNDVIVVPDLVSEVHILKKGKGPLPDKVENYLLVVSNVDSPVFSLWMQLQHIYAPKLLGNEKVHLDHKVQEALVQVKEKLHQALLKHGLKHEQEASEVDVAAIRSFEDENSFWLALSHSEGHEGARAESFASHFKSDRKEVRSRLQGIVELSPDKVTKLLSDTANFLSELWMEGSFPRGPGFPQARMENLFHVVSLELMAHVRASLGDVNTWTDPFCKVQEMLNSGIKLCENWSQQTTYLTGQAWKARWDGSVYSDSVVSPLRSRLVEVLQLRSLSEEIMRLLPRADRQDLELDDLFHYFDAVPLYHVSEYSEPVWRTAVERFDEAMAPVEARTASSLRKRIAGLTDRPHLLIGELQNFANLLTRPNIRSDLGGEMSGFVSSLGGYISEAQKEFEKGKGDYTEDNAVKGVQWAVKLKLRASQAATVANTVLAEVQGVNRLQQSADDVKTNIDQFTKGLAKRWGQSIVSISQDDSEQNRAMLGTWTDLTMAADGKLGVKFSNRLSSTVRDAQALAQLGFELPAEAKELAADADKYYRHNLKLRQAANFYNTTLSTVLPAQFTMLQTDIQKVERIVKDQKGHGWDSPVQCQKYVQRFLATAEELATRNRQLRAVHAQLATGINDLMGTNLLNDREKWNTQLQELQAVIAREERTCDAKAIQIWKAHWEHQLFKAFEYQYRLCLESLTDNLFDIEVDLFFSRKRLNFRPPLEDMRTKYYRNLKKFLDLPKAFAGFIEGNEGENEFASIPERNAEGLLTVYANAEALFAQLKELVDKYEHWVALGTVDIEDYVDAHLADLKDYKKNFDMLEKKRNESLALPDEEKIGCFTVSFAPFKIALEDLMHKFSDALLLSLRKKAVGGLKQVEEFLNSAMEVLNHRPSSVDELGNAKTSAKEFSAKKRDMQLLTKQVFEFNACLRQKGALFLDLSGIKPRWETFLGAAQSFGEVLAEQRETLKGGIEKRLQRAHLAVGKFTKRWQRAKPSTDAKEMTQDVADKILEEISDWNQELATLVELAATLTKDTKHFDMTTPNFSALEEAAADIKTHQSGWSLYDEYNNQLRAMTTEAWVAFRAKINNFDNFLMKWSKKLKDQNKDIVYDYISKEVKDHKLIWPVLQKVTGELFEMEHWKLMFAKLKFAPDVTLPTLTLGHFLAAREAMMAEQKFLDHLAARARGEVAIREAVDEIRLWAETTEFSLLEQPTADGKGTWLIKEWKDLFTKISDQQSLVGSLKESPYYPPFADQCKEFDEKLSLLDGALHEINQIQRKWVYLEPIFGRGALPQEAARFKRIDTEFRGIMDDLAESANVMNMANVPNLRDTVKTLLDQLERCQKALNDFLEEKRNKFPRFYFLGDDDLLEILGQSQNPAVIQNHLKKLFAGIHQVVFSEDKKLIVAMRSSEGEEVTLSYEVKVTDKVEVWLLELSDCMQETLAQLTVQCAKEGPEYDKYASQVLCLAEMVNYTMDVEKAIRDNKLSSLHSKLKKTLGDLTSVDVNNSKLLRLKVQALVMDLIHNIEVVQLLLDNKVGNVDNWLWQKQLRFYFDEQGRVQVVMSSASFNYTYEYQGNAGKLVHTPLTDKCYLVLTQGMHLGYGGNPYGPAGTGKTESVKALGGAMGRQVLVFNCDEGIDFQSMGRIFTGLVKSGAWGCFDEFNRLKEDQLSAVSQQIQVIQAALKNGDADCDLLGKTIEVNPNAAIFVTMNPASKEYGGRSKLPHNLKQLFRAVAMSVPDNALIAETILYSCGFKFASDVGHKLVQVYQLARQLLTPQKHYDWGLRALKTILGHGGQLIQQEKKNVQNNGGEITLALEQKLIIGSLKINTLSKLTYDDAIRFDGLINDVFPGVAAEDIDYADLESAIRGALDELHLLQVDTQIKKILQLNEALHQRMGVVVVGPSGCGKTTMLNVLHLAHKKLGQTVVRHVMNPKALEREKLLGHMDHDTREWFDGVLTASARQVVKETQETHSWIVCDGDIDPEWVESLNSVLDDNRLLTMPNGERIAFGSNVNFIFETHDLQFASPATISRMGMIFLSEENTDIRSLVVAWLRLQPEKMRERLGEWMDDLFYKALDWVMDEEAFVVGSTKVGAVTTALSHLLTVTCKAEFVTGLIRGMGSNLAIAKRNALALEIFEWSGERPPERQAPLDCYWSPKDKSFVQYTYKESTIATEDLSMSSPPIIETVDVQRNRAMIKPWLDNASPFVVVGPEGCGKTLLLTHMFKELKSTSVVTLHCSAQTQSMHVIRKLDEGCGSHTTKTGRVLRPREGERLILFLKDLNLPKPDEYDTIQMIAFLQQLVTYQGFHDDNLDWVGIEGVQIVACMNPATSVGRSELSTRFTAIVNVMYMTYPDHDQLASVYTCFLKAVLTAAPKLQDKSWRQEASVRRLAGAMVGTYEKIKKTFSSDDHRHYLFNPRDMTQWTLGLLRYDLASQNLLDVWTYESYRLFCDRLVNRDSTNKFEAIIADALKTNFKYEVKLTNLYYTTLEENEEEEEEKDQAAKKEEESEREEVPPVEKEMGALLQRMDSKEFKALVAGALYNYERENKELRMLLFPEILDHIAFEDRVLSRPGGSLLLVGDSGVGRRTATNLVCYMLKIAMYSPNISLNYTKKSFHTDIKEVLRIAGVENRKVCFFLEDHQIVFEGMLEDINSLLSASQVPGLYQSTEIEALLGPIKEEWSMDGRFRTPWAFFVDRIRTNVHVVLSFDPKNPKFGMRCESNPAIYNKCTILWMGRWSKYGMLQVPLMRLKSIIQGKDVDMPIAEPRKLIEQIFVIHNSMLARGATPLKYVGFLDTYLKLFHYHQLTLQTKRSHLSGGLLKLREAADMVDTLSKDASVKKDRVTKKQTEADEALEMITDSMAKASERRTETESLQKVLSVEEKNLKGRKGEIEAELAEIEPILESAKSAVSGIKKGDLSEIRAFRMPPPAINHVLAGVLTLLKEDDLSWENMRKFLNKPNVKQDIMNFDAGSVSSETRKKTMALVQKNANSFEQAVIERASIAGAPLAAWVKAIVKYSEVLESITPLRNEFETANAKLTDARTRLTACVTELKELDDSVVRLKEQFSKTTSEAEELKDELKKTEEILIAAQNLLGKLSGEQERWDLQVKSLGSDLETLPSQALIAAGFTTYLAGFAEDIRQKKLEEWLLKFGLEKFDYMTFMSSESEFLKWKSEGLPSDNLSMQNGLVVEHSVQTPFIIDPNMAATKWLKTHLQKEGTSVDAILMQDIRFVTTLELAVRFGKTIIVQDVEGVPPILYPLVRKDLHRQGPRWIVQVGDKAIDYNDSFRLFLVTRDPAPDIATSAKAIITEINFTVTRSGLEGQLLGMTLNNEKPELEKEKSALLAKEDQLKIQLADLEKHLLQELAASEGNILENKALIVSLDQTKEQSVEIGDALANSKDIQSDLDLQREVYRPIAATGSILYFLISQLASVNNMYQFALPFFNLLFTKNLDVSTTGGEEQRIDNLQNALKLSLFHNVTRSLFKDDRPMFALHMIHCLYPKDFEKNEWEFFTGELVTDTSGGGGSKLPSWALSDRASTFTSFSETFPELTRALKLEDSSVWKDWSTDPQCESYFPERLDGDISPFQQLLCVHVFRPDRLQSAIVSYACKTIGVPSLSPPPLNFMSLVEESSPDQPILFIVSAGADPTQELEEFANKAIGKNMLTQMAMGSGQTDGAMEELLVSAKEGKWLCLKNLHLVTSWLPRLEKALKGLNAHENFRLWLTTEGHPKFPNILLQQSLKVTYESPPGIKQNLLRTYESWDPAYISKGGVTRAQTLFCLAWFHAIVQERRTYIPQGFTKFYEFSFADLRSGADVIDNIYKGINPSGKADVDPKKLPWETIWGLMQFAIYGGRIDNDHDVRVLNSYLGRYFSTAMLGTSPKRQLNNGLELPVTADHKDYKDLILSMPDTDAPSLFCLPANIEGAVQRKQGNFVESQLRKLAVSSATSTKFNRELWRVSLAPILQLWEKLSSNGKVLDAPPRLSKPAAELQPVDSFVVLEMQKIHRLVTLVHTAITNLNNLVNGVGLLTPETNGDANELLSGDTPWRWARNWYGPEEASNWVKELVMRKLAMLDWLRRVDSGSLLQSPLSLAQLFQPSVFLNALRQQTARATRQPIDSLRLTASWEPSLLSKASVKVTVEGMLLQGCLFEGSKLSALRPDSALFAPLPNVTLAYVGDDYPEPYGAKSLGVPIYFAASREEFIAEVKMPCDGDKEDWILAGAAILLSDMK